MSNPSIRAHVNDAACELLERCEMRLRKIANTEDCGFYAELYKQDVTELLAEINQCLSNSL